MVGLHSERYLIGTDMSETRDWVLRIQRRKDKTHAFGALIVYWDEMK